MLKIAHSRSSAKILTGQWSEPFKFTDVNGQHSTRQRGEPILRQHTGTHNLGDMSRTLLDVDGT